jgi:hypothetical protein
MWYKSKTVGRKRSETRVAENSTASAGVARGQPLASTLVSERISVSQMEVQ